LKVGKLPSEILGRLLDRLPSSDPRVIVGPRIGEDAAVIDFGSTYLVAKTDPITFATDRIGWYAVNINANDVASMGAQPRWFLATLLLPEQAADAALAGAIFSDLAASCKALGISLVGGHTEITAGLDRPILVGQMLGEVEKDRLVCNRNARAGDAIILTKGIAIEATSIIARERAEEVERDLGRKFLKKAQNFLFAPGVSVVREALAANATARLHAMHDPTEGGLATGLWELAEAPGLGLVVDLDKIRIYDESERLCRRFGLDPMGVIASGALLIVAAPEDAERVVRAIKRAGVEANVIGLMTPREQGLQVRVGSETRPLPRFERDEIAKLFS
jgi:hydrogenase maturation factor